MVSDEDLHEPSLSKAIRAEDAGFQDALAYLRSLGFDSADIAAVLADIYGDSYLAGTHVGMDSVAEATGQPASVQTDIASHAASIDWSNWQPGNPRAGNEISGADAGRGLATLLAHRNITIAGIGDTGLERLARVLAEGVTAGDSGQDIAKAMAGVIDDPARAEMIAETEMNRAVSAATLDTYRDNGIERDEWMTTEGACPVCLANQAAGAKPVGEAYPSGDQHPPAHPRCRCALLPVI